ncbi:hypothetical protein EDC01DRAFT_660050 [Geopyxis carbonaria]|nr:hypothetical protein EDC01DRAFT_660050 [Geopyxis carbonaria]
MDAPATASGVLHRYAPGLIAFEHTPAAPATTTPAETAETEGNSNSGSSANYLLFVGGLGDGLFTVPIASRLLALPQWRLVEVLTSSSYAGWGVGSVQRDAEELAQCVKYFRDRDGAAKVVLMGHSTGSQDTLQYLMNSNTPDNSTPKLDGAILQSPVSDREAIITSTPKTAYLTSMNFASAWVKNGQGSEVIPRDMRPGFESTPISAERWCSLAAPLDTATGNPQGMEDFFSSDLSDETLKATFGRLPGETRVLVLYGGADEFVPAYVDKAKLVERWTKVCGEAGVTVDEAAGVVEGATHTLKDVPEPVWADFVGRVNGFLGRVLAA